MRALLDHLIGASEQHVGHRQPERLGNLEVDHGQMPRGRRAGAVGEPARSGGCTLSHVPFGGHIAPRSAVCLLLRVGPDDAAATHCIQLRVQQLSQLSVLRVVLAEVSVAANGGRRRFSTSPEQLGSPGYTSSGSCR